MREQCAIRGQGIHVGRANGVVAVAAHVGTLVVGHEEDDVLGGSIHPVAGKKECEEDSFHDMGKAWPGLGIVKD